MDKKTTLDIKVIAISHIKDGKIFSFGEGTIIENQVPDKEPFNTIGLKNLCIKLNDGSYVWGFECWWGEKERMIKKYPDIKNSTIIKSDNIQPLAK